MFGKLFVSNFLIIILKNNIKSDFFFQKFGTVCHIAMHPSFCPKTRPAIIEAAKSLKMDKNFKESGKCYDFLYNIVFRAVGTRKV